jgi:hypothetical protein
LVAKLPEILDFDLIFSITTDPKTTKTSFSISTPFEIVELGPIQTLSPIVTEPKIIDPEPIITFLLI